MSKFDVIVGGSSAAGLSAANTLLKAGLKVAVISGGFGRPRGTDFLESSAYDKWKLDFDCDVPAYKVVPVYREISPSGNTVDTKGVWGTNGYLLGHPDQGRGPAFQPMLESLVQKGVSYIPKKLRSFTVREDDVEVDFGEKAVGNALILALGTNYGESMQRALDEHRIEAPFALRESLYQVELDADTPDLGCVTYSLDLSRLHGWLLDETKDGEGQVTLAIAHLDGENPDDKLKKWLSHPYFKNILKVKGERYLRWNLAWAPSRKPYCARVVTCGEMAGQMFPDMMVMSLTNAYRGGKLAAELVIRNFDHPTEEALSQFHKAYEEEIKKYGFVDMLEWYMDLYTAFICHERKLADRIFDEFAGEPFPRIFYEIGRSWRAHRSPPEQHETYLKALAETAEQGGELQKQEVT